MTSNDKKIKILDYLKGKNIGQWTEESEIEKELSESDNLSHIDVRNLLPEMVKDKLVDFSRNQCSYKITSEGRRFN